jgi:hypothetical protein
MIFTLRAFTRLIVTGRRYDLIMVVTAPPTLPLAAKWFSGITRIPYVYLVYDLYLDMAVAMKMVPAQSRVTKHFVKCKKAGLKARRAPLFWGAA